MKKQKMNLGKKVFLNKETIVSLNSDEQQNMLGGVAYTLAASCQLTCSAIDTCTLCQATVGNANTTCSTKQLC